MPLSPTLKALQLPSNSPASYRVVVEFQHVSFFRSSKLGFRQFAAVTPPASALVVTHSKIGDVDNEEHWSDTPDMLMEIFVAMIPK